MLSWGGPLECLPLLKSPSPSSLYPSLPPSLPLPNFPKFLHPSDSGFREEMKFVTLPYIISLAVQCPICVSSTKEKHFVKNC